MDEHFIKIHKWLYPASWLYGAAVMMRNKLFDWEVLQSKSFDIPIISVGNLAVGGTGKTPHTEYLIKFLCNQYKVAVLSRGYKRHTKGYVLATRKVRQEALATNRTRCIKIPVCHSSCRRKALSWHRKVACTAKAFNRCYPVR